jgi:hypothetical protein
MKLIPDLSFLREVKSVIAGVCIIFSMLSVTHIALILNKNAFSWWLFLLVFTGIFFSGFTFCYLLALLGLAKQDHDSSNKSADRVVTMTQEINKAAQLQDTTR